jgi:hypothetical protein
VHAGFKSNRQRALCQLEAVDFCLSSFVIGELTADETTAVVNDHVKARR